MLAIAKAGTSTCTSIPTGASRCAPGGWALPYVRYDRLPQFGIAAIVHVAPLAPEATPLRLGIPVQCA